MAAKGMLYTLQSGYVSLTDRGFLKDMAEQTTFKQQTLNQTMDISRAEYYFHPVISKLAHDFMTTPKIMHEFSFRHQVLENTFMAFNCVSITDWLEMQKSSIFFSDMQKAYLTETLNFVSGGPRTMAPVQWCNLLDTSIGRQSIHFEYEKAFSKDHLPEPVMTNMHDFIHQWVSRKNGYEDLLMSLWLFFGRRTVKQSVSYPRDMGNSEQFRAASLASVVAGV